jgi:hypothetical protein
MLVNRKTEKQVERFKKDIEEKYEAQLKFRQIMIENQEKILLLVKLKR